MDILALLTGSGVLSEADAQGVARELAGGGVLTTALVARGVDKENALKIAGEHYGMPTKDLSQTTLSHEVLSYIPEESARHYRFIPLARLDDTLEVGIVDPDDIEAVDALNFISAKTRLPYKLSVITAEDFEKALEQYTNISGEVGQALTELDSAVAAEGGKDTFAIDATKKEDTGDFIKEDAPVTKIVATVVRYAVEGAASDVHIEPTAEKVRVRFRMDGELHTSLELPSKVQSAVVARIKILAGLKLDERRKPQDGRFSATVEGRKIDFRVSTFPTQFGEKVVMRILDKAKGAVTLDTLGFSPEQLEQVRSMLRQPYGIVLISGPTGSGKSTTLAGMMMELPREKVNIVTLEDPVEYDIPGISQSQVRPEIDYTFASGLRSILRQDPDIIMVGEIRDKETAQLAVQAALTGHLVLSTIHTNTATGAIPRLVDMGVDPFLIAPTLIGVIGQRLVRKLCPGAGREIPITAGLQQMIDRQFADLPEAFRGKIPKAERFYGIGSSPDCPNGTRGRLGVFEIMRSDAELEAVILKDSTEDAVYKTARAKGMMTMKEDAIIKALSGIIPFEEVNTLGGDLITED